MATSCSPVARSPLAIVTGPEESNVVVLMLDIKLLADKICAFGVVVGVGVTVGVSDGTNGIVLVGVGVFEGTGVFVPTGLIVGVVVAAVLGPGVGVAET